MPAFSDWVKASWEDYRRRWLVLLGVAGITGAATLAGAFLPLLPALILSLAGVGPAWAVWGLGALGALLAALWLSTWGQAAMTRAALTDESAAACLKEGWALTGAFGWAFTLIVLAVAGGWCLLILPGLLLSVLLFSAPLIVADGEARGVAALALSWARVRPRLATVALRVAAAGLIAAAPGWLPHVGWLIAMFWTPIGLVLLARLARDLRAAEPAPETPRWMGAAVTVLALVFVGGTTLAGWAAARGARAALAAVGGPE
ncbi:MAG: hypothetical protein HY079_03620, partial [Elusimicrobia bacterium]|nr:hypothetical protein [Elusimicrobiota bacterium]